MITFQTYISELPESLSYSHVDIGNSTDLFLGVNLIVETTYREFRTENITLTYGEIYETSYRYGVTSRGESTYYGATFSQNETASFSTSSSSATSFNGTTTYSASESSTYSGTGVVPSYVKTIVYSAPYTETLVYTYVTSTAAKWTDDFGFTFTGTTRIVGTVVGTVSTTTTQAYATSTITTAQSTTPVLTIPGRIRTQTSTISVSRNAWGRDHSYFPVVSYFNSGPKSPTEPNGADFGFIGWFPTILSSGLLSDIAVSTVSSYTVNTGFTIPVSNESDVSTISTAKFRSTINQTFTIHVTRSTGFTFTNFIVPTDAGFVTEAYLPRPTTSTTSSTGTSQVMTTTTVSRTGSTTTSSSVSANVRTYAATTEIPYYQTLEITTFLNGTNNWDQSSKRLSTKVTTLYFTYSSITWIGLSNNIILTSNVSDTASTSSSYEFFGFSDTTSNSRSHSRYFASAGSVTTNKTYIALNSIFVSGTAANLVTALEPVAGKGFRYPFADAQTDLYYSVISVEPFTLSTPVYSLITTQTSSYISGTSTLTSTNTNSTITDSVYISSFAPASTIPFPYVSLDNLASIYVFNQFPGTVSTRISATKTDNAPFGNIAYTETAIFSISGISVSVTRVGGAIFKSGTSYGNHTLFVLTTTTYIGNIRTTVASTTTSANTPFITTTVLSATGGTAGVTTYTVYEDTTSNSFTFTYSLNSSVSATLSHTRNSTAWPAYGGWGADTNQQDILAETFGAYILTSYDRTNMANSGTFTRLVMPFASTDNGAGGPVRINPMARVLTGAQTTQLFGHENAYFLIGSITIDPSTAGPMHVEVKAFQN